LIPSFFGSGVPEYPGMTFLQFGTVSDNLAEV
jgi:hypothetical protein